VGRVKFIAYAGATQALEEKCIDKFKRVGGTSGGAIIALFLEMGYSAKKILALILKIDFQKFSDNKLNIKKLL